MFRIYNKKINSPRGKVGGARFANPGTYNEILGKSNNVDGRSDFYRDDSYLIGCAWSNLVGLMILILVLAGHLLAIPFQENQEISDKEEAYSDYFYGNGKRSRGSSRASSVYSRSTGRTIRPGKHAGRYHKNDTMTTRLTETQRLTGLTSQAVSEFDDQDYSERASTIRSNRGKMKKQQIQLQLQQKNSLGDRIKSRATSGNANVETEIIYNRQNGVILPKVAPREYSSSGSMTNGGSAGTIDTEEADGFV